MLKECGLWPERGLVLECPASYNRPGCDPEGGCCARRVLEAERDFQDQKGRLQEEVEALGHSVLFYPKLHCEPNFIERYWCQAKWFARENCGYDFEALKTTVPEALASVTNSSSAVPTGWQCAPLMLILLVCIMGRRNSSKMHINHIGRWKISQSGELV